MTKFAQIFFSTILVFEMEEDGRHSYETAKVMAPHEIDPSTLANLAQVRLCHLDLDLGVDFPSKTLAGTALLTFQVGSPICIFPVVNFRLGDRERRDANRAGYLRFSYCGNHD